MASATPWVAEKATRLKAALAFSGYARGSDSTKVSSAPARVGRLILSEERIGAFMRRFFALHMSLRPLYAETGDCQNRSCCPPVKRAAMIARAPLGEILRHLRAEPSRTWSVIITVFGDAIVPRGGSVWLGTLVRFFAALGSNDGVVRTAMSRLAADGWLERSRVGRNSF